MFRTLAALILPAGFAFADPAPLVRGQFAALVLDSAKSTLVIADPAAPFPKPDPDAEKAFVEKLAADSAKNPHTTVSLTLDWLGEEPKPGGFTTGFDATRKIVRSTLDLGGTHITKTTFGTKDAIFIHLIADKPGAVSFRATLQPPAASGKTTIEDRREIAWTSTEDPARKARVWIIPFESDVETDGDSILLRGEGECLVVFAATVADDPQKPLSGTWSRLAAAHDPGADPPDPTKIWQAILTRVTAD